MSGGGGIPVASELPASVLTPGNATEWYRFLYGGGVSPAGLTADVLAQLLAKVAAPAEDALLRENLLLFLQDSAPSLSEELHM
jgi:hypothetical protein